MLFQNLHDFLLFRETPEEMILKLSKLLFYVEKVQMRDILLDSCGHHLLSFHEKS